MSNPQRLWTIILGLLLIGGVAMAWAMHDNPPTDGVAVVELFTSEGCSSCPPADALLAKLVKENHPRVYPLAFHVDYWDTPQWHDTFSDPRFSRRQEDYAKTAHSRDVYTPQMIVNGSHAFVGSDQDIARNEIAAALKSKPPVALQLTAKLTDRQLTVECTTDPAAVGKNLNLALVQRGLQRKIAGGENAGRTLSHENVVRDFQTLKTTSPKSAVQFTLPADADPAQCSLIAYVQDDTTRVLGAGATDLNSSRK